MKTEKEYIEMLRKAITGLQDLEILIAIDDNTTYGEELTIFPKHRVEILERNYSDGKKEYVIDIN